MNADPGPGVLGRLFPALAEPLVRRYFVGQSVSVLGVWIQNITLNLAAWALSGSPALLGALNFLLWGPAVVLAPLAGPHATQANARRLAGWTVAGSLGVALSLAALSAAGRLTVPLILGLAAVRGVFSGLEVPARQILLTTLVADRTRIGNAVAMNAVAYNTARMLGPAAAAALFGTIGATSGFVASAAAMSIMLAVVISLPRTHAAATAAAGGGERPGLRAAIDYVRNDRLGRLFLPVTACLALLASPYQTLVPVLADRVHGSANAWTGAFYAAAGAGSTVAALLLSSRYLDAASRRLQVLAPWSVVLALAGLGTAASATLALCCFALLGFALTFTGPGTNARLQQHAPPALRGALFGLYALSFTGAVPIGNLLIGLVAQWLPVQRTFLVMAALLSVCLALLFVPRWIAHGRLVLDGEKI